MFRIKMYSSLQSILKDKLPDKLRKEEFYVIELSQDNKLLRIEEITSR